MNLPPTAWVILALGLIWLVIRTWTRRIEERRREERDVRLAELYAEREAMQQESAPYSVGPSSIGAVVSDSSPPSRAAQPEPEPEEKRCVGCRTVNAKSATTCSGCGLEL